MDNIRIEKHEQQRVAVLYLARGEDNRLHPDLITEFLAALDELEKDRAVKALVVTGANPKFFCNGLDLEWMMGNMAVPQKLGAYMVALNQLYKRVTLFPKPVVAALNGHTFAGGLFLAAHMDFRLMRSDRGWCCMPESDINIPLLPGMIAICEAVMPPKAFRQLYYTGKRFTGPEAEAMGFVDATYEGEALLPAAIELAGELGRKKTRTYGEMKKRIRSEIARILDEEDPKHFMATLGFAV